MFASSGQAAVITPRQVTVGLGSRRVKAIAAAKHHTVIATESGEVFTWGSNRGNTTFLCHLLLFMVVFYDYLTWHSASVNYNMCFIC